MIASVQNIQENSQTKNLMPTAFIGHGSPMNAINENEFVLGFREIAKQLPPPKAILVISAHWYIKGTRVTGMENPPTIHDFSGFPRELYQMKYPAPGAPDLALEIESLFKNSKIEIDFDWGLDHGAWSVLVHLFPKANIPVLQLSLDRNLSAQGHYDLAKNLSPLRRQGVFILGSGNLVHNLGMVAWDKINLPGYAYDWASDANERMKACMVENDHQTLIHYATQGKNFELAIPTPEHFLPLLYILALKEENEKLQFFNDRAVGGSLTMTSVYIGE